MTPGPLATLKHLSSGMLTPFGITFMAVGSFKMGDFQLSAQVSAVAVQAGASANAKFRDGIAVFAIAKGNFTYEASVGGQKFTFKPKK